MAPIGSHETVFTSIWSTYLITSFITFIPPIVLLVGLNDLNDLNTQRKLLIFLYGIFHLCLIAWIFSPYMLDKEKGDNTPDPTQLRQLLPQGPLLLRRLLLLQRRLLNRLLGRLSGVLGCVLGFIV